MEQNIANDILTILLIGIIITSAIVGFVGFIMFISQALVIKWKNEPNGYCPVQAEGWFIGYYFYFRSRYETAKIEFSKSPYDLDTKYWDVNYITKEYVLYKSKDLFEAGYIKHSKARRLIYWGCFKFLINRIIRNIKEAIWHNKQQ